MKKLILLSILFVIGCEEPGGENIIDLPTEFPLVVNTGWVYQKSTYNTVEDYLSGNNPTITKDTIVILDTSQDCYLWYSGGSNIDSNSIALMYKNYDNKLLYLGVQEILSEDVTYIFDKPYVMADFSDEYIIDTVNYVYPYLERTTTIDTLFENLYHTYVFPLNLESIPTSISGLFSDITFEFHFTQEGMSYYNSAVATFDDILSIYKSIMIEKLDYIEININVE